jgi:hypothetical protein
MNLPEFGVGIYKFFMAVLFLFVCFLILCAFIALGIGIFIFCTEILPEIPDKIRKWRADHE